MKTRVLSAFFQPLCWLFRFKKQQGMSNSCFYSFCRFVKAGLCSLTAGHTQTAARVVRRCVSRWAESADSSARERWCLAPIKLLRSGNPDPLGMLLERDKQTLQAAFLLPDLKKKKKNAPRDNLPSVATAQKHETQSQMTWTWAQILPFLSYVPSGQLFHL